MATHVLDHREGVRPRRIAAVAAALGFGAMAVFQAALAAGAPLGEAAWGGTESQLANSERFASGVSVVFYAIAAAVVLRRAGLWGSGEGVFVRWATWFLVGATTLGAFVNVAAGQWERFLLAPLVLLLAILCLVVARTPLDD